MNKDQDTGATLRALYAPEGGTRAIFPTKVADYAASRPDYPAALFEFLKNVCTPSLDTTVADTGAGTGLLTRGLLSSGYKVIAVEPNPEMRRESDRLLGGTAGYSSAEGCAESIPLQPASVHLITAAQAFHWFEIERARAEFLRVLAPQGQVALIWNDRVQEDPLHLALNGLFSQFGGDKRSALVVHEDLSDVPRFFGSAHPQELSWPHSHRLDESGFISLVFSRSYMPARNTREGDEATERARPIFHSFAVNGTVAIRYKTVVIIGRLT
ncbi:MAG TPA: class I SAM-dependent methyltransferase [Clostridia bacterium]|nr:class I SAM-dependent methyltransferase [Clostridia bacterium]